MNEVVELTGAERTALVLMDAEGGRRVAAQISPVRMWELGPDGFLPPARTEIVLEEIAPLLDECERKGSPLLSYMPEGAAPFEQCSILVVPLVAVGKLVGLVYTELDGHFGRFHERDRDLLSVLANQAAVAVENANWAGTLERRVAERTAELTIINSIGEAMARQLDVDTIVKIVGDKVREIFQAEVVTILLYDADAGMIQEAYAYDRGDVTAAPPFPLGQGMTSTIIGSRRPLVSGSYEESAERGAIFIPSLESDEELAQSYLGVPIIVGERVIGVVSVQSYRRNAYDEAAVRLLSTLAANMGVAIENARLFQETRRLLKETEQRAGELAVINSVQQGLASKLETQAIIDLVGDKLCEVLDSRDVAIRLYDRQANLVFKPPICSTRDRGLRVPPVAPGPSGVWHQMQRTLPASDHQ